MQLCETIPPPQRSDLTRALQTSGLSVTASHITRGSRASLLLAPLMVAGSSEAWSVGMDHHRCSSCKEAKPKDEFHRHARSKSGVQAYCKVCTAARAKAYAKTDSGRAAKRRAARKWEKTDRGRELVRASKAKARATPHGKAMQAAHNKKWRALRPWGVFACAEVNNAVSRGRIPRPADVPCEIGEGCSGRHSYHHDSYARDKWLEVRCLCRKHHDEWHRQNTAFMPTGVPPRRRKTHTRVAKPPKDVQS
jgi:hypothetical protein